MIYLGRGKAQYLALGLFTRALHCVSSDKRSGLRVRSGIEIRRLSIRIDQVNVFNWYPEHLGRDLYGHGFIPHPRIADARNDGRLSIVIEFDITR